MQSLVPSASLIHRGLRRGFVARLVPMILLVALASSLAAAPPRQKRGRSAAPGAAALNDAANGPGRSDRALTERMRRTPLSVRAAGRRLQLEVLASTPRLDDLRSRAAVARTDREKRAVWNEYNARLYGEMRRRQPTLTAHVNLLERLARARYNPPPLRGEAIDAAGYDRPEL